MPGHSIGSTASLLQENLARSTGLPFLDFFAGPAARDLVAELGVTFRQNIFTPVVTMLAFVAQILDPDGSCRKAVSRVIATTVAAGGTPPSNNTSAYCQARSRLPERFFFSALRWTAERLDGLVSPERMWLGRHRVRVVDGSSAQAQDTAANRAAFWLPPAVTLGCGFPVVAFVGMFSLATGALVGLAVGRKREHERHLFRRLWDLFRPGDVALGDRGFCHALQSRPGLRGSLTFGSYADIARLLERDVESVFRIFNRDVDFRRGKRLGKDDHIVTWLKPTTRPRGMTRREFPFSPNRRRNGPSGAALPETLTVRELRVRVERRGYRTRVIDVVTTLLDAEVYTKDEIAGLYRRRWEAELNFRHIKTTLGMELLRTKTPSMARKEMATCMIAYNLIRALMWEAGTRHDADPLRISLKGTMRAPRDDLPSHGERPGARAPAPVRRAAPAPRPRDRPRPPAPRRAARPKAEAQELSPHDKATPCAEKGTPQVRIYLSAIRRRDPSSRQRRATRPSGGARAESTGGAASPP